MDLQTAKIELLYEASRNNSQLFLIERSESRHVNGFSAPYELREIYVSALESLAREGSVKALFKNREMQCFQVTAIAPPMPSMESAKQRILEEIQNHKFIFKVHSSNGEYVQCVAENFERFESIRILYLRALGELLRRGTIDVQKDSRDVCVYVAPRLPEPKQEEILPDRFDCEPPFLEMDSPLDMCA